MLNPASQRHRMLAPALLTPSVLHAGQRVLGAPMLRHNAHVRLLKGAARALDGRGGPLEGTVLGVQVDWLHVTWLSNISGAGPMPLGC